MIKNFHILILFLVTHGLLCQEPKTENREPDFNSEIRSGELENGFRYFIKPIEGIEEKINLKLIVKAGTLQESSGQNNLAHLLEHMAFNGTENFPDLRNDPEFYSRLEIQPQDLRASVGGDRTIYSFKYPQQITTALDTALAIYHDIASGKVLFDEDAVEGERKAVYQEGIAGGDPGMIYPYLKIKYLLTGCSDISAPGAREAVIMNTSIKDLKQFYDDWYRPDLMALTVVGNIKNLDQVEEKIKLKFKGLKNRGNSIHKKDCRNDYLSSSNKFIIIDNTAITTNTLLPQYVTQFYYRLPELYLKNLKCDENRLIWDLIAKIVDNRLKSEQFAYNINYTTTIYQDNFWPVIKLEIKAPVKMKETIRKVFNILSGISLYGFTEEEWGTVVNEKIKDLKELNYRSTDFWSKELENSIVEEKELPNPEDQGKTEFLHNLTIEKINRIISKTSWKPDDIALIVPKNSDNSLFNRSTIKALIDKGLNQPKRYNPITAPDHLISYSEVAKLHESKIIQKSFGDYNEDIISLENGLQIILKDLTPEKGRYKDKVMIHGFSPFGANCFEIGDMEAMLAPFIIENAGVGNYNKFEIDKLLSQTSFPFGIRRYINPNETGVKVELSPRDMELALQLIFLSFTNPRFNEAAFDDWKLEEERKSRRNINAKNDFVDFINHQNGILQIPRGGERYRQSLKVDYKSAFEKYKDLHENASNFTFIITGDFKKSDVLPLLQKYLGNLPTKQPALDCTKLPHKNGNSSTEKDEIVHFKIPYKVNNNLLAIQYSAKMESLDFREVVKLEFLGRALDLKLKSLRYEKNFGIYSSAGYSNLDYESKDSKINISLESNKDDMEKVLNSCNTFFEELKSEPVSKSFLRIVKETSYLPKWQNHFQGRNKAMQLRLYDHYRFGFPTTEPQEVQKFIDQFTSHDLQNIANKYLKKDNKRIYIGGVEKYEL